MGAVYKPLQAGAVTAEKIAAGAVTAEKIAAGAVVGAKLGLAAVTPDKLNGAQSGNAQAFACRAWVNFTGYGTVAIRASGNVTSITDHGTGNWSVNFGYDMPDVNYAVFGVASRDVGGANQGAASLSVDQSGYAAGSVKLCSFSDTGGLVDGSRINIAVIR